MTYTHTHPHTIPRHSPFTFHRPLTTQSDRASDEVPPPSLSDKDDVAEALARVLQANAWTTSAYDQVCEALLQRLGFEIRRKLDFDSEKVQVTVLRC